MTHEKAVECLDQIEDCLVRAETSKKDLDLLVALRVLYLMCKDKVRETEETRKI